MSKKIPIDYTSRDFDSIKSDLVNYCKRYYPDTMTDFGEASFGSMMLDSIAYVGDILSFYLDYQANESFLETAVEYDNILKLGNQMGYKFTGRSGATGLSEVFLIVPANSLGLGPDTDYLPVLQAGSEFTSDSAVTFTTINDVRFDHSENEVIAARVDDSTGIPTHYAVKAVAEVISGNMVTENIKIGDYEKFKKIKLSNSNITEIISVFDAEGHEYFEVDYLSQNVIYKDVANRGSDGTTVPSILRPHIAPRRFSVENLRNNTFIQFGYGSDSELTSSSVAEPSELVMSLHGKKYVSDETFDPSKLLKTDKFGVAPANTSLTIKYRVNTNSNVNIPSAALKNVSSAKISFNDPSQVTSAKTKEVISSLEISNSSPIVGDVTLPDATELKTRMNDFFATQNRAVTGLDMESMAHAMPSKYGSIKRCKVVKDSDSFKRNLNLYVLAQGSDNKLSSATSTLKQNLKVWLGRSKMINDTIDIMDGKIVNIGIEFTIQVDPSVNKYEALSSAITEVQKKFVEPLYMGEPLYLTDIYSTLNRNVAGVIDTKSVKVVAKTGTGYSNVSFDLDGALSVDARYLDVPHNVALEIKYPSADIKGTVE
tara:strand:- start:4778 stop:6571 length:1794 start_codon:yes stop_codon:yes gene_type:complete